jgi:hypothetical protein
MSFLQLFAAGKGLIGMTDGHTPYRMRRESQLPKFHSMKNPFAPQAKNDAGTVEPGKSQPIRAESAATPAPAHAPAPSPAPVKVAPMETYPLFDAELKPAVTVNAAPPVRGGVRVVCITQSKLPVTQAKPGWSEPLAPAAIKMDMDMGDTAILGKKRNAAKPPGPLMPAPVGGLADTSPLGLKSGTPTKPVLPEPVAPRKNKKPVGETTDSSNNYVEEGENIEHRIGESPLTPVPASQSMLNHVEPDGSEGERQAAMGSVSASGSGSAARSVFALGSIFALVKKVNPMAILRGRRAERKAVRAAVQTELSLDRVKVIRNDLSDADLEVVTVRSTQKPSAPTPAPAPRMEPVTSMEATGLGRLTARFFGAGQTMAMK